MTAHDLLGDKPFIHWFQKGELCGEGPSFCRNKDPSDKDRSLLVIKWEPTMEVQVGNQKGDSIRV